MNKIIVVRLIFLLAFFLVFLLVILTIRYKTNISKQFSFSECYEQKRFYIGLLATFKNEEMIIDEWINHYIWQGIDRFYLIDNGSTDKTKQILEKYIQMGLVTYFFFPEKYSQVKNYNNVFSNIAKNECDWLVVCDIDEYIYHRKMNENVKTYLKSLDYNTVSNVSLSWKLFGSSGYSEQPQSIRTSFLFRGKEKSNYTKVIINTKATLKLDIHIHVYYDGYNQIKDPTELHLNHYRTMSKEYFQKTKMTRGDSFAENQNVRDISHFNENDKNDIYDDELMLLVVNNNVSR